MYRRHLIRYIRLPGFQEFHGARGLLHEGQEEDLKSLLRDRQGPVHGLPSQSLGKLQIIWAQLLHLENAAEGDTARC